MQDLYHQQGRNNDHDHQEDGHVSPLPLTPNAQPPALHPKPSKALSP